MSGRGALLAAALATVLVATEAAAAAPTTLVRSRAPIAEVAQDGGRIAWTVTRPNPRPVDPYGARRCSTVYVRRISGGRPTRLRHVCHNSLSSLVLSGRRAAWSEAGGDRFDALWEYRTAALDDRVVRRLDSFYHDDRGSGSGDASRISAGRGTLAYGWRTTGLRDAEGRRCEHEDDGCRRVVVGGGARGVVDGRRVAIPDVGPVSQLAASAGRIAFVQPEPVSAEPRRERVEVRDAVSGAGVAQFVVDGRIEELALGGSSLALVVVAGETKRLERYDAMTGTLAATTPVAAGAGFIDVDGDAVVFLAGRSVLVWRGTPGSRTLWQGRRWPGHPSIDGGRVVWSVGGRRESRIFTATVPAAP